MLCCQVKDLEALEASSDQPYWEGWDAATGVTLLLAVTSPEAELFSVPEVSLSSAQAAHEEGSMWDLSVQWDCSSLVQRPRAGLE